jgi:IS30 family transposase
LEKAVYRAAKADRAARELFSYSHSGVSLTPDELGRLDALVTPLIKNGQSPWHICETHRAEAMVCDKTLYRYIQDGLIGARSTDLTRKVSMRPRRTTRRAAKVERRCRDGRALGDYNAWLAANPDVEVPQADTVYGAEGRGHKCLMTVCFPASGLLLAYIRDANTAATANAAFARIAEGLGAETFAALFPAILTDNGPEFSNPTAIERPLPGGAMLTRVFYCDPMASWQKPSVENSHLMLRRIFPKGASMDAFSQRDVAVALSHINSYARRALGGQTPIDVFAAAHGTALLETAGITRVMPDDIMMRPSLIGR